MPKRRVNFEEPTTGHYWRPFRTPWPTVAGDTIKHPITTYGYEDLQKSSGHPWRKLGKSTFDIGGDFRVIKHSYRQGVNSKPRVYGGSNGPQPGQYVYDGPLFAKDETVNEASFPAAQYSTPAQLAYYGTKAIALTIPTNPVFDAATFLGELREGIPRLVGSDFFKGRSARAKAAGSEYLNLQFGWNPLVNDVKNFAYAVKNSDEILRQYERNSGKRVKRRLNFPTDKTITSEELTGTTNTFPKPILGNGIVRKEADRCVRTTTTITERWFSACFTYYLPPLSKSGSNIERNLAMADKLYGVRLTPETLWNLTPWSWGADWFGNFGDVVHNVSAFAQDGLVMPYGYIMERKTIRVVTELFGVQFLNFGTKPHYFVQEFVTTTKSRQKATPFGFGLNPSGFTGRQWAITAALGLSRGGNTLP